MFFDGVVNTGSIPAMDKTLTFLQARLDMIAENIANADTPGYRTKQLDAKAFQRALGDAMAKRLRGSEKGASFFQGGFCRQPPA